MSFVVVEDHDIGDTPLATLATIASMFAHHLLSYIEIIFVCE